MLVYIIFNSVEINFFIRVYFNPKDALINDIYIHIHLLQRRKITILYNSFQFT